MDISIIFKKYGNIIVCVICIIILIFMFHKDPNSNTITTSDIRYIIKQYDSNFMYSENNFQAVKDNCGRTIGTFTYTAHPINVYGVTFTDRTITNTIRIIFMKKNGKVQYDLCPTNWMGQAKYKNYDDFLLQHNWGKPEKQGLGSNAKSFKSD